MDVYIVLRGVDDFFRLSFFAVVFELCKCQNLFHVYAPFLVQQKHNQEAERGTETGNNADRHIQEQFKPFVLCR